MCGVRDACELWHRSCCLSHAGASLTGRGARTAPGRGARRACPALNEEDGMGRQQREVNILLVEDNPDHAELTLKALKDGNLLNAIFWVKDGEEALDFLYHRAPY